MWPAFGVQGRRANYAGFTLLIRIGGNIRAFRLRLVFFSKDARGDTLYQGATYAGQRGNITLCQVASGAMMVSPLVWRQRGIGGQEGNNFGAFL